MMHRIRRQFERFEGVLPGVFQGNPTAGNQRSLLRMLAVGRREGLDPAVLVRNLAAEHPGRYGRKLQNVERWLAAGSSLVVALAQTPGALNEQDTLAIQCGIETGLLDETFDRLLDDCRRDEWGTHSASLFGTVGYIVGTATLASLVALFLSVAVIPTFVEIFEEFDLELPAAMSALATFTADFVILIPLLLLAAVAFCVMLLSESFGRRLRESTLSRWWRPTHESHRAGLLRLLALPTAAGQSIQPTVTAAAQYHRNPRWRKRLLQARTNSDSDDTLWRRLATEGLITGEQAEQLLKVDSPRLRGWTLETLAEQKSGHSNSLRNRWAGNLQAVPALIVGAFVGWVAVAVIQTLTQLIHTLTLA